MSLFEKLNNKRYDLQEKERKKSFPSGSFDPANQEKKFVENEKNKNIESGTTNYSKNKKLNQQISQRRSAETTRGDAINRAMGTSGSTEGTGGANTDTATYKPPSKKKVKEIMNRSTLKKLEKGQGVSQAEVSKKAKEFTKKVNKERLKKLPPIDLKKPTVRKDLRKVKRNTTRRRRPSNAPSLADINKKIDAANPVEIGKTGPKPVKGTVLRVLKKGEVASKSVMQKNVPQGFVRIPKKDTEAQNILKKQVKTARLLDPTPKPKPSTKPNLFSRIKNFVKGEPKIPGDYNLVRGTTNQPLSVTRKVYKGKLGAVRKFVDKLPRKYKLAGTALIATAAAVPSIKKAFAPKPEKKSYTVANKTLKLDTGKKNT